MSRDGLVRMLVPVSIVLLLAGAGSTAPGNGTLEPEYETRRAALAAGDAQGLLDLAGWSRDRGLPREMLDALGRILESDSENASARAELLQTREGDRWACSLRNPPLAPAQLTDAYRDSKTKLLARARNRIFKLGKQSFRFDFYTDLEKTRVAEYEKLMTRYYAATRGIFGKSDNDGEIPVYLYGRRSDYLRKFQSSTGKSGEHTSGFFSYGGRTPPYLCFYDDPHDTESIFNTAKHECTHLLVYQALNGARIALWMNEGFACFLAGNGLDRYGSYAANCYLTVRRATRTASELTLDTLMNTPQSEFGFNHYAHAWAWINFLSARRETKGKLPKVFFELRQKAASRESDEWGSEEWEEFSNRTFESQVGAPAFLQAHFAQFVEKDLAPRTEAQRYFAAEGALNRVRSTRIDPPLTSTERTGLLRDAEGWLKAPFKDPELAPLAELQRTSALLSRALSLGYDRKELVYTAAEIARELGEFVSAHPDPKHAGHVAGVAHLTLRTLYREGEYKEASEPTSFLTLIRARQSAASNRNDEDERFLSELEGAVAENLIARVRNQCQAALLQDPGHSQAALRWLLLALEFSPELLEQVFPHTLAQVEIDPNDLTFAALAAAYSNLGQREYAHRLLDRAYHIAPDGAGLDLFAEYVKGYEGKGD